MKIARVGSTAQRLAEKPYEKRVCRVECYPNCLVAPGGEPYVGVSVEEYADIIDRAGLEVQIVGSEIDRGTPRFRSKMIPFPADIDQDRLPGFLKLAHEKGIIVLTYYPMNYCKPLKKIHPEWLMEFLDDGRPEKENLGWFCFNSPYRDWLPEYLCEFLDNLDLDGLYFDDMNWGSHEGPEYQSCCCKHCEARYLDETGRKLPRKVDLDSADFKMFINWRYEKMREFIIHIAKKVKSKHPDAILDFNYYGNCYWNRPEWASGHPFNPLGLEEVGGHFFVETDEIREGTSFAAKMAQAHGTPFAIWRHAMQVLPECSSSSAPYSESLSPTIHGMTALANGGAAVFGMFDGPPPLWKDMMTKTFSEIKKREDYIETNTIKYIALHYSQQTRDFRHSKEVSHYFKGIKGAYEMFNQAHLLADILFDRQLKAETLSQYKILFLSNSACLSEGQCEEIKKFVEGGGTLIATHETSLLDEYGRKREDFCLNDVLGLKYQGSAGNGVHGVINIPHDKALSREFGPVVCYAAEESRVSVKQDCPVEVLCTKSILHGKSPLKNFDLKVNQDSGEPSVTVRRYGQGQAIYISGNVGNGYFYNPYPQLKRFVAHLVQKTQAPIEIDAPNAIEVTAFARGSQELLIHLVNHPKPFPMIPLSVLPQEAHTHFYLEEVNPIFNIKIGVNHCKILSATMPLQNIVLAVQDQSRVIVPEVKLHEVVLLQVGL